MSVSLPLFWLDSSRGQYIPRDFARSFPHKAESLPEVDDSTWAILEAGPDHENYWDAWSNLDNALVIGRNGVRYHIHHDGDVWLIPVGMKWDEKIDRFVWDCNMTKKKALECSICGGLIEEKPYWKFGNNAQPINDGRCCDSCNMMYVIPARLKKSERPIP